MSIDFRLMALLLTFAFGVEQAAQAQDSSRVVFWSITISSKAQSMEKARELHKQQVNGVREQQSKLKVEDDDVFLAPIEMRRIMYRTIPRGYEFRQVLYIRQFDTERFDDFFSALAPKDSKKMRVSFNFRPASWQPPIDEEPKVAVWNVTVIGGGKTLVESKEQFEARLVKIRALLEEFEIASVATSNPWMITVPEQLQEDDHPTGYKFQRTLTFRQKDMEKLESLLDKFVELDTEYLHVDFSLETVKK